MRNHLRKIFSRSARSLSLFVAAAIAVVLSGVAARATWSLYQPGFVNAIDFYSASSGLISQAGPQYLIQKIDGATLSGVFQSTAPITGIVIQDSTRAWATDGGTLYIGDQQWTVWTKALTAPNIRLIGATPSKLFLQAFGKFYYTTTGASLVPLTGAIFADSVLAIDYFDNSTVFALAHSGLYRSTDAGLNWTLIAFYPGLTSVYAARANRVLYLGGSQLMKSTDSGGTWTQITAPAQFGFSTVDGTVIGAHDCSGLFYVSNGASHGSVLRSTNEGATIEDVGSFPVSEPALAKGWVFDRGAVVYWFDQSGLVSVSRDAINGEFDPTVSKDIAITANQIMAPLCNAAGSIDSVILRSDICTSIRIDSITILHAAGTFSRPQQPITLAGDSSIMQLTYHPLFRGTDSIAFRLWFHSLETGAEESKDFSTTVVVRSAPAVLSTSDSLSFGAVHVDSISTRTLVVSNRGCDPLRIDSIVSSDPQIFVVAKQNFPVSLANNESLKVAVQFDPHLSGDYIESLELGTSAGHEFVELSGNGTTDPQSEVLASEPEDFRLYPNPVSRVLTITGAPAGSVCQILDLLGREILHLKITSADTRVSTESLPNGMYHLRLGSVSRSFMVSH